MEEDQQQQGTVFGFALAMLVGAYVAGNIPLSFSLSDSKLRFVSALGCGLLIGTALSVIIPEGIETLYSVPASSTVSDDISMGFMGPGGHINYPLSRAHDRRGMDDNSRGASGVDVGGGGREGSSSNRGSGKNRGGGTGREGMFMRGIVNGLQREEAPIQQGKEESKEEAEERERAHLHQNGNVIVRTKGHGHGHGGCEGGAHSLVGMSLTLGFLFMLLVDYFGETVGGGGGGGVVLSDLENNSPSSDNSNSSTGKSVIRSGGRSNTTTIGLVVHSAADGIALGAAVSSSKTELEMLVFIAIMLHKAPAAFGLTSFLLHEGLDRATIRKHLLLFSAAAPFLSVVTYAVLRQSGHTDHASSMRATGLALLFSAGTFLYVSACHVLPEIRKDGCSRGERRSHLLAILVGAFIPSCISMGHSH
eukprot:Nk52_evm11s2496 gene=Nk52_evmTU11s2496